MCVCVVSLVVGNGSIRFAQHNSGKAVGRGRCRRSDGVDGMEGKAVKGKHSDWSCSECVCGCVGGLFSSAESDRFAAISWSRHQRMIWKLFDHTGAALDSAGGWMGLALTLQSLPTDTELTHTSSPKISLLCCSLSLSLRVIGVVR